METLLSADEGPAVDVINREGRGAVVFVCEHASAMIPAALDGLGVAHEHLLSHAAWDPGALAVAMRLSAAMDAPLVAGRVSRLVYDCNRPPEAPDAMPARSEVIDIPGNAALDAAARAARVDQIYRPFADALTRTLRDALARDPDTALITVHSFTPFYHGEARKVELGVLSDSDTRLADAIVAATPPALAETMIIRRDEPYGPRDGVMHTLRRHGLGNAIPHAMLEIRNDLIITGTQQDRMAGLLRPILSRALASVAPRKETFRP